MAYINKLDTEAITLSITPPDTIVYTVSSATIELDAVIAYSTFVDPLGNPTTYTLLYMTNAQIVVDETYATIDGLINP